MKKGYIFLIIIFIAVAIGVYFIVKQSNNTNNSNVSYNTTRVNAEENTVTDSNTTAPEPAQIETETEISSFTTKIYTKDKERQNNISITCSTLNDTYVENSDIFSFCDTVGKATSSKGYQKADVFKDGEVIQALGGGNCQISSTLYNAVLKVPELEVVERHEHSNSVPYVSKGKDAAVAYGTYDFKFKNNIGNKIKIAASCDKDNVYIKIYKLE